MWTTERPTQAGWYWFRFVGQRNPELFTIIRLVLFKGFLVDEYTMDAPEDGEWQPVQGPRE